MKALLLPGLLAGAALAPLASGAIQENPLSELPGFGLSVREPSVRSDDFELTAAAVEKRARQTIAALELPLVSEEERKELPGQPYLEIAVEAVRAQGPSHLYLVALSLRERAALERPQSVEVTVAASSWQRSYLGVANRPEAVLAAADRLLRAFASAYAEAND